MFSMSSKSSWILVPIPVLQADMCHFSCLWGCAERQVGDQIEGCFTVKRKKNAFAALNVKKLLKVT